MASMYAQYLMERTNDFILEIENGWATYRYLDDGQTVYIVDTWVHPDFRRMGLASSMADTIVKEAKDRGCTKLIGSVVPSTKNSTGSILAFILGYQMKLDSSSNNFIVLSKEI